MTDFDAAPIQPQPASAQRAEKSATDDVFASDALTSAYCGDRNPVNQSSPGIGVAKRVACSRARRSEADPLCDEGAEYARLLDDQGVDVRFLHQDGVPHLFLSRSPVE